MRVVPHYVLLKKNYEVTQTTFLQVVLDMLRVILSYVVRRALSSVFLAYELMLESVNRVDFKYWTAP